MREDERVVILHGGSLDIALSTRRREQERKVVWLYLRQKVIRFWLKVKTCGRIKHVCPFRLVFLAGSSCTRAREINDVLEYMKRG